MKTFLRFPLWLAVLILGVSTLSAQTTIFSVSLNSAQEVPSNPYSGTGSGTLQINNTTFAWTLSGTFTNLYGTSTDAHIHGPAAPGVNAPPVVGINFTSGQTSGTFSGSGTFSAGQAADLFAGLYYINIHTNFYPNGEIRGQLTAVPEPATYALIIGVAGLAVALYKRRSGKTRDLAAS
jgi:hypothetical protein